MNIANLSFLIYKQTLFCYNVNMNKKSLSLTNPFLKVPGATEKLVARSVRTSCGVEGIRVKSDNVSTRKITRRPKKIYGSKPVAD